MAHTKREFVKTMDARGKWQISIGEENSPDGALMRRNYSSFLPEAR